MANDFKVHGKMLVKNFRQAFREHFGVDIKVHQGFSMGQFADDSATLASIRSEKAKGVDGAVELHGNMKVGTAEKEIKDSLGFAVQIQDKTGKNADNDDTLSSLR